MLSILSEYTTSKHNSVDDYPYGGGAGMVLTPQPIFDAVEELTKETDRKPRIVLMCPQGERFTPEEGRRTCWRRACYFCMWPL